MARKLLLLLINVAFALSIVVQNFFFVFHHFNKSENLFSGIHSNSTLPPREPIQTEPSSVLDLAGVPLRFAEPYSQYDLMGKLPAEAIQEVEREKYKELSPKRRGPARYLIYTPTDGFGNQVASLVTAIKLSWLTRRILVLPPILGHYEGPARGNCHNPAIVGLTNQSEIKEAYDLVLQQKIASGQYVSITSILDLGSVKKFVRVIDARDFYQSHRVNEMETFQVPYDCCACADTVWLTYPLEPKDVITAPNGVKFRTVEKFLAKRREPILSMGSVYFPNFEHAYHLFNWAFTNIFRRVRYATQMIPYSKEITEFGRKFRDRVYSGLGEYGCVHIRISDSYFQRQKDEHLATLYATLLEISAKEFAGRTQVPLLVLADTTSAEEYGALVRPLVEHFEPFRLEERWGEEVALMRQNLGFNVDIMHLEAIACANAGYFVGHRNSTFSKRIAGLRLKIKYQRTRA